MNAAHKNEATTSQTHHNERLKDLLLNHTYNRQSKAVGNKPSAHQLDSRIEAEYQMEAVFRNLF